MTMVFKKIRPAGGHTLPKPCSDVVFVVCLAALVLALYWQVTGHDFVDYDDGLYVTENRQVRSGLTPDSLVWAFTTRHGANWHPVTWVSHMLDVELHGMHAGGHHLTSVLFHAANTCLIFWIFRRMTGARWRSAALAVLFAVHPLHVESVAWVAERKDVLSTFFGCLMLWSYGRYVRLRTVGRYAAVVVFFTMGLMSKPMVVTLPFVLLLLDYWPLARMQRVDAEGRPGASFFSLVMEKLPLMALSAAASVMTLNAQQGGGAVISLESFPVHVRIMNALVAYASYIWKTLWPSRLSVFYPLRADLTMGQVAVAFGCVAVFSFLALRVRRTCPWMTVGWLWYLGTLVPVIGLVQVGSQALADRYMYVPSIGLFIIVCWGAPALASGHRHAKPVIAAVAAAVFVWFPIMTWHQVAHWKDSRSLFTHALGVTRDNYAAHNNLGLVFENAGNREAAVRHYAEALRIHSRYKEAHNNMGRALVMQGMTTQGVHHLGEALKIDPGFSEALNNMGVAMAMSGNGEKALTYYRRSIAADPQNAEAWYNMGCDLYADNKIDAAIGSYTRAIQHNPYHADYYNNLGVALAARGDIDAAMESFRRALTITPDSTEAINNIRSLSRTTQKAK